MQSKRSETFSDFSSELNGDAKCLGQDFYGSVGDDDATRPAQDPLDLDMACDAMSLEQVFMIEWHAVLGGPC